MSQIPEPQRHDPDTLLGNFNRSTVQIVLLFIIAALLHGVIIGASSVTYIRGVVDPEWKEAREKAIQKQRQEEELAKERAEQEKITSAVKDSSDAKTPSQPANNTANGDGDGAKSAIERENEELKKNYSGETIENITSMPEDGEIPDEPEGKDPMAEELGISFDDTKEPDAKTPPPVEETTE